MMLDKVVVPDGSSCQDLVYTSCISCFLPRILCICKTDSTVPESPTKSEHAFLVSQKLPIDFDGAENPPFSLPSPEDEIADLCGRLDKSLKIANELIEANSAQMEARSEINWSDEDEIILKAPKKIDSETKGTFSVGASGSLFTVMRHALSSVKSSEFDIGLTTTEVFSRILETVQFKDPFAKVSGKLVRQPSQMAWFGDVSYTYRGMPFQALPLSSCPTLVSVANLMNNQFSHYAGHKDFNSVFVHLLEDCTDNVDWSNFEADKFEGNQVLLILGSSDRSLQITDMNRKRKSKKNGKPVLSSVCLDDGTAIFLGAESTSEISSRIPRTKSKPSCPSLILLFKHVRPQAQHTPQKLSSGEITNEESRTSSARSSAKKPSVPPRPYKPPATKLNVKSGSGACSVDAQTSKEDCSTDATVAMVLNAITTLTERIDRLDRTTSSLTDEVSSIKATQSLILEQRQEKSSKSKEIDQKFKKMNAKIVSCTDEFDKFSESMDSTREEMKKLEDISRNLSMAVANNSERISRAQQSLNKCSEAIRTIESCSEMRPNAEAQDSESSISTDDPDDRQNDEEGTRAQDPSKSPPRNNLVDGRQYSELFATQYHPVTGEPSRVSTRQIPVISNRPHNGTRSGKKKVLYLHDSLGNSINEDKLSSHLEITKVNMKTLDNALKNWQQIAASSLQSDAVIIGLGLNDLRTLSPETAADKLFRLIDKILIENTGIKILVSCLVPVFSI